MTALDDAVAIVTRYLRLVEERKLAEASEHLAPTAEITFPGDRRFGTLREQVAAGATRFRRVRKEFRAVDVLAAEDAVVVYVLGTLDGEDLGGGAFAGVRFIDRFELRDGLIVRHDVWNDMAESGVLTPQRGSGS